MGNNYEILKLKKMLEEANIPFKWDDDYFGIKKLTVEEQKMLPHCKEAYQIVIYKDEERLCDAIYHYGNYGYEEGLLEIMGGITQEESGCDSVLGHLTAEEVFKRFKYCYENSTDIFKGEE